MPNTFKTVSRTGFGSRIMSAIVGVPIGIILIFGSCIMLYWNEGRVDYSKIASKSTAVPASQIDQSENGKFVSVTGVVSTNQQIGDGAYLKPGPYIAVQRTVGEYAWVQTESTQSQNNTGGSSTNTTTYNYTEEWTNNPQNSSTFQYPQGHQNPSLPIESSTIEATSGQVGAYSFDPQTIKLPALQNISLNSSNINLPIPSSSTATTTEANPLSNLTIASPQYLFGGGGSLTSPQLGAIRISYQALQSGTTVTVFGQLNNGSLTAYTDSSNHTIYDLLNGDRQTAIATLHSQYEKTLWLFRLLGIGLIWLGLMLLFNPLDTLLDFIPIVGEIGGLITVIITLPVALILGGSVIIVSYSVHRPIDLVIVVILVMVIWIVLFKMIKKIRNIPKRGSSNNSSPQTPQQSFNSYQAVQTPVSGSLFPNSNIAPQPIQPNPYNSTPPPLSPNPTYSPQVVPPNPQQSQPPYPNQDNGEQQPPVIP